MVIRFEWLPVDYLLTIGLAELGAAHYRETYSENDRFDYDIDWDQYRDAEANQSLRFLAVLVGKVLVGYAVITIKRMLYDKKKCVAFIDEFYLSPPARKGWNGARLFKEIEHRLAPLKVSKLVAYERLAYADHKGGIRKLFEFLNWRCPGRIWVKDLGGGDGV